MDLLNMPNLCAGGKLAALVFCCSTRKECPVRDKALEILGISKEDYEMVKSSMDYRDDRLCYGNLAFCCSLEEECRVRDTVMRELGMSPGDYIAMKKKLLEELKKVATTKNGWNEVIMYKMLGRMVVTNADRNPIYMIAMGNPEISDYIRVIYWEEVEEEGESIAAIKKSGNQILSLRLDNGLLHEIDMLSMKKGVPRSRLIREILRRAIEVEKSDYKKSAMKNTPKTIAANCQKDIGNPL